MNEIKKLVEFLDDLIIRLKPYIQNHGLVNLTKIKEILERQSQPDEELVEKIIQEVQSCVQSPYLRFPMESVKANIRSLLQSRQPKLFSELAKIIEWLYMSEKVQLAQSDITKFVNRLEAIEKLLQSRQSKPSVTREEIEKAVHENWDSNWHDSRTEEGDCDWIEDVVRSLGFEVKQ